MLKALRLIAAVLVVLATANLPSAPVCAQDDGISDAAVEEARLAFQRGNEAYIDGHYRDAAAAFETANRIVPNPRLLEYIGRCYANVGDYVRALEAYEAFAASSTEAAAEIGEVLSALRSDAITSALYESSDRVDDALARANGETPPPRDLRRQELGTRMRDVEVHIRSNPRGAEVYIDAIELGAVGITPLETPLFTGRHFVEVRAPFYEPANRVVNVTIPGPGESIPVFEFELVRQRVQATVTVDPITARVTFVADDGTRTDMGIGGWEGELPAGPGAFIVQQGGRDRRIEAVVEPDDSGRATLALTLDEPSTTARAVVAVGTVVISADQLGAGDVRVDGRSVGSAPGEFEAVVTAGSHTIEIVREGYVTWRQDIEVSADQEVRVYAPSSLERARRR